MIHSSAFESFQRYQLLNDALISIKSEHGLHPYHWLTPYIYSEMQREADFMRKSQEKWEKWLNELKMQDGNREVNWKSPKEKPEFDVYILVEYEFTSMGGPHLEAGEVKCINRDYYFCPREGEDREDVEWRYVNKWVYLEDAKSILSGELND